MQTQLHKKIINMKNKKNTKHQTQIKRNNLKTKTHYLQGSLLEICKPNYTKKSEIWKRRKPNIKLSYLKRNNFKEHNLQKKPPQKKHTHTIYRGALLEFFRVFLAFSSSLLDTIFCGDLKGESCTTSLRLRHLIFDGVPS